MRLRFLIAILSLLVVVLISGCVGKLTPLTGGTNLAEIINNPEKYTDPITIRDKLAESVLLDNYYLLDEEGYKLDVTKCIEKDRHYEIGSYYEVKGYFKFYEECYCQDRYVMNITEEEWEDMVEEIKSAHGVTISKENVSSSYLLLPDPQEGWSEIPEWIGKTKVSSCEKPSFFKFDYFRIDIKVGQYVLGTTEIIKEGRCVPNSIGKVYYFECTEPMKKL